MTELNRSLTNSIISVKKLSLKIGNRYIFRNIDWEIKPNENWLVFGLNGSGKTSLLSTIAGFGNYTEGSIAIENEIYTKENVRQLRQKVGWVSTSFFEKCYKDEKVSDIIFSGITGTLGVNSFVMDKDILHAKQLLQEMKIGNLFHQPFSVLSKGERQMVLIIRAIMAHPSIMIMDEPVSGLDLIHRENIFSLIRDMANNRHLTILYVTHYVDEILDIFDKTLLLKNGKVYAKGETNQLFQENSISKFMVE